MQESISSILKLVELTHLVEFLVDRESSLGYKHEKQHEQTDQLEAKPKTLARPSTSRGLWESRSEKMVQ
jgi:hypothetical protein